jgi:hypothetical protein
VQHPCIGPSVCWRSISQQADTRAGKGKDTATVAVSLAEMRKADTPAGKGKDTASGASVSWGWRFGSRS